MVGVVQHESGLCKNLLQEFAQKNGYPLPQYKITRQGEDHSPTFTSTVEIAGVSYSGGAAKNKKEAEIKAARTAFLAIQATQPGKSSPTSCAKQCLLKE
jgi:dsRNA-specific ribonuclease